MIYGAFMVRSHCHTELCGDGHTTNTHSHWVLYTFYQYLWVSVSVSGSVNAPLFEQTDIIIYSGQQITMYVTQVRYQIILKHDHI